LKQPGWLTAPLFLLGSLIALDGAVNGVYLASSYEPPAIFTLLSTAGVIWGSAWLVADESKKHRLDQMYCPVSVVWVAWIIAFPYYILRARGLRGVLVLLGLFGLYIISSIGGIFLSALIAK